MLSTARLNLRPLTTADVDALVALHADARVNRFVPAFSPTQARERLERVEAQWAERGHGLCAVELRDTGEFIGRCGLNHWPEFDEVEAGWTLAPRHWGHGYATEAARACVDWGFDTLDVDYLTAMIHPENEPSARVAHRLGFAPRRQDTLFGKPITVYALDRPPAPNHPTGGGERR
ncbi:GNAT family N-acetyltransferase [Streptomyces oceani]|uniref:GCN5 family acetyltransferase n=1 Tax=Streptomyces oceani TaxID=1075402 RepID=A0A1E7JF46_9ACTN|nr:GNAT family N-acetyltransferase [Streptomyces oceani]OEU85094.1 GCN5 family acetyltransferase [Streptomyces oceani]